MIAERDFASRQSLGARSSQEDACAFSEIADGNGSVEGMLAVVADGMGGHSAGERASKLAVESFVGKFRDTHGAISERILQSLNAAQDAIRREVQHDPALGGMGTTLVAAAITSAGLEWISVGDSPLYLLRGANLERLNEDHSMRPILQEKLGPTASVDSGSVLRSVVGLDEIAMIDRSPRPFALCAGDLVVVTTDGIHTLKDREIIATCADSSGIAASALADALIQAVANAEKPRQDNVTIAVIKAPAGVVR